MMKRLATFFFCLIIFKLSIAASRHDNRERIFASQARDSPITTSKRGVLEFGLMIICGVENLNPTDYIGYGCYCGLGGSGTPVDDTDRCCQVHDECYEKVKDSGSCPGDVAVYAMPYNREGCYGCKPKSYYWFYAKCRHALCKCDSEAVQCFIRTRTTFNSEMKDVSC